MIGKTRQPRTQNPEFNLFTVNGIFIMFSLEISFYNHLQTLHGNSEDDFCIVSRLQRSLKKP